MKTLIFDLCALAGLCLCTAGAGLMYAPFWFLVPGLFILGLGIFGGWTFRKQG